MADTSIPPKRCSKCGEFFPPTHEYFPRHHGKLAAHCKECDRARTRKYYTENKDKVLRRTSDYAKAHPEQSRAKAKKNYYKDHERSKEMVRIRNHRRTKTQKQWYQDTITERKAYDKKYRDEHHDQIVARGRKYYAENPEKALARYVKRRARELGAEGHYNKADVQSLLKSQKGKCWWCGKPVGDNYHVDHRVPLTRGGTNWPNNLCISCPECNRSKSNKLPSEWSDRLL